jgi:SulP family sulfate permease
MLGMTAASNPTSMRRVPIFAALRRVLSKGYGRKELRSDLMAGAVVGVVALPLSMALAIAVGAPPQHGLYTAIVAGALTALFGGCKFQVTGPTAAFVVVLAPILVKHGLSGLLTAGVLAGVMLIAMGLAGLGSWIQYIPQPVTSGFTAGIAAVIATLQLKDVLGLKTGPMPEHYVEKLSALWNARGSARISELAVAAFTLALILLFPRITKRVPAALVAISTAALAAACLHRLLPGFEVDTIGSRFHTLIDGVQVAGIPSRLPSPGLPWGSGLPSFALIRELFPAAFAIAMLGAIESLLSAVIADGMTNTKHEPNSELVALGIGNIVGPIFGGIAATGALARTGVNIRAGARSPFAAIIHSIFVLLSMLVFAPLLAYVPMAALSALLLVVAWNMSEVHTVTETLRVAPKSDNLVLITCFLLTVFFDMVAAVSVGFVLAAVLFMRRMSELTDSRLQLDRSIDGADKVLPRGVVLYEINGPLFFGAAQKAMRVLDELAPNDFRVLVIHLGRVPVIDATGLRALRVAIEAVLRTRRQVVLAGPLPKPRSMFTKADLEAKHAGQLFIRDDVTVAVELATSLASASLTPLQAVSDHAPAQNPSSVKPG